MVNRLIIAAAGSGKTTYLVRQAMQQSDSVLITTYTIANELEIRKKIVELSMVLFRIMLPYKHGTLFFCSTGFDHFREWS